LALTENHATDHAQRTFGEPLKQEVIPAAQLAAYSALSLPLAMAALPIYVHVPKLYVGFGLSLAWIGGALLALRALDAVIDPLLGKWSDAMGSRKRFIAWALPFLLAGVFITFTPHTLPFGAETSLLLGLALTYFGFSAITIAYHAWGAQWTQAIHERTRITTWREGVGLIGVLIAAAVPVILTGQQGEARGYARFALIVIACALIGAFITLAGTNTNDNFQRFAAKKVTFAPQVWRDHRFQRLLAAYALNGIAAAIPATLFLFFIADVVKANEWQAQFLVMYFISGALAAPAWLALSKRVGKRQAWGISMIVAILTFCWAAFLGPGDRAAFMAICILSGIALGADLTLPPSMLADTIAANQADEAAGAYFGVWTMVTKLNLALAAGVALPALAWMGYVPDAVNAKTGALTFAYCVLPCVLKALALVALKFVKDESYVEQTV
jgi:glycoside/pentoside/hexuronide:cation symporter, GPH family